MSEIEILNKRVEYLDEELETYKNPGTIPLRLVLKYPLRHNSQPVEDPEAGEEELGSLLPKRKKRKTMPFSQLLTNEKSLQELREAEEKAERAAIQKRLARDAEKAQKQEAQRQKKEEKERLKAEKQHTKGTKKKKI
ncbi:20007_t:CDS:2 [Cetraspora pellucida]|uniref:20007_t:CDS:1 n=1 Tax=Cetraspora pellucida TaxID=1433469 RepID=A0A9N9PBM7_9GLOM|nr:20007_t:CDS:2 [Cetraspora pellucida]